MRILIVHSRYLTGDSSGENRVVDDEARLLAEHGHQATVWAPSYDISRGSARGAVEAIWSRRATREVRRLMHTFRPDVVHVHNLFPALSPAVLRASARHCPVVMTLHNFRLVCLPATLLRDNRICEDCVGHLPLRGVVHACYRESRAASAVLATSLSIHRAVHSLSHVSLFAPVSAFVGDKLRESGVLHERVRVKPNFAWPTDRRVGPGEYFLTLGRLSPEKGIDQIVRNLPPGARLLVVGDGPQKGQLASLAGPGVEFRPAVAGSEVPALLRGARALVVPSRCYEGQPRVILEAFAAGVPVLASHLGGLPDLVEDQVNGFLVGADNGTSWRLAAERLTDDETSARLGHAAYRAWQRRFTPEQALSNIEDLYAEAQALQRNAR